MSYSSRASGLSMGATTSTRDERLRNIQSGGAQEELAVERIRIARVAK